MSIRIRHQLVFVLLVCLLSLVLGACGEKKEKAEAYVEEVQERGQVLGFQKVNAYTIEKEVRGVINGTRYMIVDIFDQNGNYIETEVGHYNISETITVSSRRTILTEPLTLFLKDVPLTHSSTITLSASEQEELQEHINATVQSKFPQQNNKAYKEVIFINVIMLMMIVSLFILGLVFKRFKWHMKFAQKIITGILSTILLYVQLKGIDGYSTKIFISFLLVCYSILGYQLVKDIKQRTKEKASQSEI